MPAVKLVAPDQVHYVTDLLDPASIRAEVASSWMSISLPNAPMRH